VEFIPIHSDTNYAVADENTTSTADRVSAAGTSLLLPPQPRTSMVQILQTATTSSLYIGSLTGPLQAITPVRSLQPPLSVATGGRRTFHCTKLWQHTPRQLNRWLHSDLNIVTQATAEAQLTLSSPRCRSTNPPARYHPQSLAPGGDGYLSSTDWNLFNNKVSSSSLSQNLPFTPPTALGPKAPPSTLIQLNAQFISSASLDFVAGGRIIVLGRRPRRTLVVTSTASTSALVISNAISGLLKTSATGLVSVATPGWLPSPHQVSLLPYPFP